MGKTIYFLLTVFFIGCFTSTAMASDTRSELFLNGTWQTVSVTGDAVPTTGWTDITVPATTWQDPAGGSHFIWFRKTISIPPGWNGWRIFLDFHGARFAPHLYIDGKLVASQLNGFAPFKTEITPWVKPGSTSLIELSCEDCNALFKDGFVLTPGVSEKGQILAPAGGYKNFIGVWDDITLNAEPQERINEDNLVVAPSTRKGTLALTGTTDGGSQDLWVAARVLDGSKDVLDFPKTQVSSTGTWQMTTPFPGAHFWSPEDPHLYTLEVMLYHGTQLVDTLPQTFGFKEIWTEGSNFYLNGVKRHLLASASWPIGEPESDAAIDAKVRAIRASNTVAFRLHNQTWPEEWLRAADKAGLMIVDESPLYTDSDGNYAYTDPRFWSNYRDEVSGMISRDRNHPSVVLWSLENETLFIGSLKYDKDLPEKLGDIGRFAKQLDPNHPITYEGDQDPDGAADVIGLHYPHELPWSYDYPNTTNWLGAYTVTQATGGLLGTRSTGFFWERKKPLYIGEYLWLPQGDYSDSSIYFGDDAYLNRNKYHDLAQQSAFYDQTIGYRRSGVSGMGPWSVFGFGGKIENPAAVANEREFFAPVAAFPTSANLRRFGGEQAKVSFDVFDDDGLSHRLNLKLQEAASGKTIAQQSFVMQPGDYRSVALTFPLPRVTSTTTWSLESVLYADGKPVHSRQVTLRIFPVAPLQAPAGTHLLIYDPSGQWPGSSASLAGLENPETSHTVLVVAPGGLNPSIASDINGFLSRGGRALILDQQTLSPLGLDLNLVDHNSTMTFPLRKTHPILQGLQPEDLSLWAPDNYVTKREITRPSSHGARAVTVSGGQDDLAQSPIIESPVGRGWVVVCQALVAEKRTVEPAAQVLLQNTVNYLASMPAYPNLPVAAYGQNAAFKQNLGTLGIDLSTQSDPTALILDGGGPDITGQASRIKSVLNSGGIVYWHAPAPDAFTQLQDTIGANGLQIESSEQGTSLLQRENPLLSGVSREDLTYAEISKNWDRPLTQDVHASSCQFIPIDSDLGAPMPLVANGTGTDFTYLITVPTAGLYELTLTMTGASAVLRVDVNDIQSSWLQLGSTESRDYETLVNLEDGKNVVTISGVNGSNKKQYHIDGAAIRHANYPAGMEVPVLPGAVITWKQGRGRVVLDGTEWDSNTQNAARGARYASALFSALGVAFTVQH